MGISDGGIQKRKHGTVKHVTTFLLAAILVFVVYPLHRQEYRNLQPVTNWFGVDSFIIPDHEVNSNPEIKYSRTVKTVVIGEWTASIFNIDNGAFEYTCGGNGKSNYSPDTILPEPVTWNWLIWDKGTCQNIKPGRYIAQIDWIFAKENWPDKSYSANSNVFLVLPKP